MKKKWVAVFAGLIQIAVHGQVYNDYVGAYLVDDGQPHYLDSSNLVGRVYIGYTNAFSSLTITSNRLIDCEGDDSYIGYNAGANSNTVSIIGMGSAWNDLGYFYVGYYGAGNSLAIEEGGQFNSDILYIGSQPTASGNMIRVSGVGSLLLNQWELLVGDEGDGCQLIVEDGGSVRDLDGYVGNFESSGNVVSISGSGSVWSNGYSLVVGVDAASNTLSITEGGKATCNLGRVGGMATGDHNAIVVSGYGSCFTNHSLIVGGGGSYNALVVTNGGRVEGDIGYIGYDSYATSNLTTICGPGSVWDCASTLSIGGGDPNYPSSGNQLTVNSNGMVAAGSILVAAGNMLVVDSGILEWHGATSGSPFISIEGNVNLTGSNTFLVGLDTSLEDYHGSGFDLTLISGLAGGYDNAGLQALFDVVFVDSGDRAYTASSASYTLTNGDWVVSASQFSALPFDVRIASISIAGVELEFDAVPGGWYTVQYSQDLAYWESTTPPVAAAGKILHWTGEATNQPVCFYRVVKSAD